MFLQIKNTLNKFLISVQKNLTLFLFLILPNRVASLFVSLSILSLIYDVKNIDIRNHPVDYNKFKSLLNITFNEEIMLLPQYTVNWFWNEDFLNSSILIDNNQISIKEAITNNETLFYNLREITEILLQHIPKVLKYKLNLDSLKEKLIVKHNVMNLLLHV